MRFIDEVEVTVIGGKGGNGCVSFRREKFIPRGGPNGGDGGKGGSVYLVADTQLSTLSDLRYKKIIKAGNGENGKGKDMNGKNGENVYIRVPVGTIVRNKETGEIICDLVKDGEVFEVAKGGRGGRGNKYFATSTNRAPFFAEDGKPGETKELKLELKLLADVGVIGYPNAGKSTLISVMSNAKPKIADYPFTTLNPNLGVVEYEPGKSFVIADIPGIIEGAAEGKGLGLKFLKHIERTRLLVHLVDISIMDIEKILENYKNIRKELEKFNEELAKKKEIVCFSKVDIANDNEFIDELTNTFVETFNKKPILLSSVTNKGIEELKKEIIKNLYEKKDS